MAAITIATVTIPNWNNGPVTGVALYVYCNAAFTASDGTIVPQTQRPNVTTGLGTFFQIEICTTSGSSLVVPAITLESTTDSPDNPNATYSAVLWDTNSNQFIQTFGTFTNFSLPNSPTSTTWDAVFTANAL